MDQDVRLTHIDDHLGDLASAVTILSGQLRHELDTLDAWVGPGRDAFARQVKSLLDDLDLQAATARTMRIAAGDQAAWWHARYLKEGR